jgi:hypothetical protein
VADVDVAGIAHCAGRGAVAGTSDEGFAVTTRRARIRCLGSGLAVALLAMVALPRLAAAATVSLPANTSIAGAGATAQIAVTIDDASQVEAVDLRFTFDPAVLAVTGDVTLGSLATGCTAASNASVAGALRVALACPAALSGGGTLFTIPRLRRRRRQHQPAPGEL